MDHPDVTRHDQTTAPDTALRIVGAGVPTDPRLDQGDVAEGQTYAVTLTFSRPVTGPERDALRTAMPTLVIATGSDEGVLVDTTIDSVKEQKDGLQELVSLAATQARELDDTAVREREEEHRAAQEETARRQSVARSIDWS